MVITGDVRYGVEVYHIHLRQKLGTLLRHYGYARTDCSPDIIDQDTELRS